MTTYFIRMFAYTEWANARIVAALAERPVPPADAVKWINHIVGAQSVWLGRVDADYTDVWGVWPARPLSEVKDGVAEVGAKWTTFLARENDESLRRQIAFRTLDGTPYETALSDILAHVVNHSTHHRAQIASALRQAGAAPPPTDYIRFVRETAP